MTRLGLSKLKPTEMKPTHCQYNKWQQCRMRDCSLGQELLREGQHKAQAILEGPAHKRESPQRHAFERLVEHDSPFARRRKLPDGSAQCWASASWPGWEGCRAAQPHRDWLEEQGHPCEEWPTEGKLQEQFSST